MDKLKRFLNGDDRDDDSSTGIIPVSTTLKDSFMR